MFNRLPDTYFPWSALMRSAMLAIVGTIVSVGVISIGGAHLGPVFAFPFLGLPVAAVAWGQLVAVPTGAIQLRRHRALRTFENVVCLVLVQIILLPFTALCMLWISNAVLR
ncbi:MAG: hypothetical protein LC667_15345 [Thioalkalivibrio sp.]|nr:hypothetical protein [Thioalkalivibrio sp.]